MTIGTPPIFEFMISDLNAVNANLLRRWVHEMPRSPIDAVIQLDGSQVPGR